MLRIFKYTFGTKTWELFRLRLDDLNYFCGEDRRFKTVNKKIIFLYRLVLILYFVCILTFTGPVSS